MGIRKHGGDHAVVERASLHSVDDPARDFQLVLRDVLRLYEMIPEVFFLRDASKYSKRGCATRDSPRASGQWGEHENATECFVDAVLAVRIGVGGAGGE